jgi:hypothetical protein
LLPAIEQLHSKTVQAINENKRANTRPFGTHPHVIDLLTKGGALTRSGRSGATGRPVVLLVDCPAIDGIIEEADDDSALLDAALIAAAQAVEHYEITRYGSLIAWAQLLDRNDCASVLQQTLDEEKATDKKLTANGGKPAQSTRGLELRVSVLRAAPRKLAVWWR